MRCRANAFRWWYSPVLPKEQSFPAACRQILTSFLVAVSSHLSRKRPADTFLDFLTNSSSIVIVFLSEISAALRASGSSTTASDAINEFLEANPSSSLATVLDVQQQKKKLQAVAEEILRSFVDPKAYVCDPVRIFLREILAGVILEMTVVSCSRAEFINDWIIYSLEEGNAELLDAFDAGVDGATTNGNVKQPSPPVDGGFSSSNARTEDLPETMLKTKTEHKRTVSRAEDAMEEAMREAQRLSELIAAEEAKKEQSLNQASSEEDSTLAEATPTSTRDDLSTITENIALPVIQNAAMTTVNESRSPESVHGFTTFDQIISSQQPTALQNSSPNSVPPLTLHNASVSIFDDSVPGDKGLLRSKPTVEYLLQVEPATSQHPGWMIARIYSDFETLHEVLRRISVVSGVADFAERYQTVPAWKNQTKAKLRTDLEHYLREALSFQRLAESEGMKRFLEKDQGLGRSSPGTGKGGFGFPTPAAFETMGKGMLDVLASAPKGAAGGGKAILGGVTGVFGGGGSKGQKRLPPRSPAGRVTDTSSTSSVMSSRAAVSSTGSDIPPRSSVELEGEPGDSPRHSLNTSANEKPPPLPHRKSQVPPHVNADEDEGTEVDGILVHQQKSSQDLSRNQTVQDELHLPPPPSEITDDYNQAQTLNVTSPHKSATTPTDQPRVETSVLPQSTKRGPMPLSSQETSVAVELFFAIINELYTLSSAWTLRLTLLNAAKSFLLRPGNPNLEAIRVLLQTTVIDANTMDAGIASHLHKLRENAMPTEEELKAWPPPPSEEEKERKKQKAKKLLVQKGMPQALTSVMGAAASGEALGKVFDCLQVPEVARGLAFALILQGVRAVTQ